MVYRFITKRTYEAEMFERATKKLGLDQAIFMGGEFKSTNKEDENNDKSRKINKGEVETLLKKGILGLIVEENENEIENFFKDNIDTILEKNTRIAKYSLLSGAYSFSKS